MKTWLKVGLPAVVTYGFAVGVGTAFGWNAPISFAADSLALASAAFAGGMTATVVHTRRADARRARDYTATIAVRPPTPPEPMRHLRQAPPIEFGTLNDLLGPLAAAYNAHSLDAMHGVRMWGGDRSEIVQCSPLCIVAQTRATLRASNAARNAALTEATMRMPAIRPMDYRR